jgi:trans-aconitate methyltransferase
MSATSDQAIDAHHARGAHYTFGDSELAVRRLRLLAAAFAPSSRAFLREAVAARPHVAVALDLGCGPGYSTALLSRELEPVTTIGLDSSRRYIERAREYALRGLEFVEHDLTRAPFPTPPADLLYGRFVVTHLPEGHEVIDRWADGTAAGARLVLEEVATLDADDEVLRRYYELVVALQAAHGQATYVGRALAERPASAPWAVERAVRRRVVLPAATAAELHALNFATWRHEPFIEATVPADELDHLGASLRALALGGRAAAPVRWELAQVVMRRR